MKDIKQIRTGYGLLVSSHSFLAQEIQQFQDCIWNHASIFIWLNEVLYVCEAAEHGICLTPFTDYLNSDRQLLICIPKEPLTEKEESNLINFCLPYCGHTPYEKVNLVGYQSVKYTSKRVINGINKLSEKVFKTEPIKKEYIWIGRCLENSNKRFICGEWVMYVLNKIKGWFAKWNEGAPEDIFHSNYFTWELFER